MIFSGRRSVQESRDGNCNDHIPSYMRDTASTLRRKSGSLSTSTPNLHTAGKTKKSSKAFVSKVTESESVPDISNISNQDLTPFSSKRKETLLTSVKTPVGKWMIDAMGTANSHISLRWRHNDHAGVSNHQPHGCLLNCLFRRKSKKTSKLRVTGLCVGNSPGTGEFPAQRSSYAENVSIWWHHHA